MRVVDPIALMRKRDWCLLIACCCVWLSHWVEIGNAGDASAFGIVQVPFRITSSLLTFPRCAWAATFICLLTSALFNGNTRSKLSWLAKVIWILAAFTLIVTYDGFARSTFLEKVDIVPLAALFVIGCVQGVFLIAFVDFAKHIRSKKYALERGLPRIPDQVMRGMMGSLLFVGLLILPCVLIIVSWCRSSVITQLCVVMGAIIISVVVQVVSDSSENCFGFNNRINVLFDMVDRRRQMEQQIAPYKDSPLIKKGFERPSEWQTFLARGMQSHFNYELEWKYVGQASCKGESMLRFSYQEDGDSRETLVPVKVAMPYVKELSGKDNVSVGDVPKGIVEKATTYATIDLLLKSGGLSLLWACINDSRKEDLEVIIRAEPDINSVYGKMGGWTVLMLAVAQGFTCGVELLLKYAADPNVRNANGVTPFLFAVRYDNLKCVQLLYDAGANIKETDAEGSNALIIAAKNRARSVVPFLIAHGVDVRQKNLYGRTALEYAQEVRCGEMAMMLRRKLSGNVSKKKLRKRRRS